MDHLNLLREVLTVDLLLFKQNFDWCRRLSVQEE